MQDTNANEQANSSRRVRRPNPIVLALLALIAFWNALAIVHLLEARMASSTSMLAGSTIPDPTPTTSAARGRSALPILERNPFDHVTGPLLPRDSDDEASDPSLARSALRTTRRDASGAPPTDATPLPSRAPAAFRIDHELIERARRGDVNVAGLAQAVPVREDGHIVGVRLSRIGGLLGSLGLREGDVLKRINGFPVGTAEQGFAAYAGVANATQIVLELRRGGAVVHLAYAIE